MTHSCQSIDLLVDVSHAAGGELGVLLLRPGGGVGSHHKAGLTSVVKSVMNSAQIVPDLIQEVRKQQCEQYNLVCEGNLCGGCVDVPVEVDEAGVDTHLLLHLLQLLVPTADGPDVRNA